MTNPSFNDVIRRLEKVGTPKKITVGGMPEMVIGGPEIHIGVYTDNFDRLKRQLEK